MFHRRCDKRIDHLERLLDEEREKNKNLQEQMLTLADKPVIPVGARPANVFYMDEARLMEMEADGDIPT
jgi:hypothetical protein